MTLESIIEKLREEINQLKFEKNKAYQQGKDDMSENCNKAVDEVTQAYNEKLKIITKQAEEIKGLKAGHQAMYQYLVKIRCNPGVIIAKALGQKEPTECCDNCASQNEYCGMGEICNEYVKEPTNQKRRIDKMSEEKDYTSAVGNRCDAHELDNKCWECKVVTTAQAYINQLQATIKTQAEEIKAARNLWMGAQKRCKFHALRGDKLDKRIEGLKKVKSILYQAGKLYTDQLQKILDSLPGNEKTVNWELSVDPLIKQALGQNCIKGHTHKFTDSDYPNKVVCSYCGTFKAKQALGQKEPTETPELTKCPRCNRLGCICEPASSEDMTKQVNKSFKDYNNET